jgi:hypothetical protein
MNGRPCAYAKSQVHRSLSFFRLVIDDIGLLFILKLLYIVNNQWQAQLLESLIDYVNHFKGKRCNTPSYRTDETVTSAMKFNPVCLLVLQLWKKKNTTKNITARKDECQKNIHLRSIFTHNDWRKRNDCFVGYFFFF